MPDTDALAREIKIMPSYDHRHEPADSRGAHGADLFFILRGPLGALTARIGTGWMAHPLAGPLSPFTAPLDSRRRKPGVDATTYDMYPMGVYVGAHSIARREGSVSEDECDLLPGGTCWGTGGYLIADQVILTLVTMGSDGVWHQLESYYEEWIVNDPVADGPPGGEPREEETDAG